MLYPNSCTDCTDCTFFQAYALTKKHVCIPVTSSGIGCSGDASGSQKLLLNHLSIPNVLLASAVGAVGAVVAFEVDGVDWIDGSVQADMPFRRMAMLFSVSNFVMSQDVLRSSTTTFRAALAG